MAINLTDKQYLMLSKLAYLDFATTGGGMYY